MDYFRGVTVEVTSNGRILPLYDDPEAPDHNNLRERQRYIESTTGASFAIKVTLTREFQFGESQAARVAIAFDGDSQWHMMIKRKAWLLSRNGSCLFSNFTTFCPASSTWKRRDFLFGGLDITESSNTQIHSAKLKALGQIEVSISRGNIHAFKDPRPFANGKLSRVAEVSEKTLKGNAISSTVSYTNGKPVAQPADIRETCIPIPGPLGNPIYFKIFYRSKNALQMLGCLPRTPSPEAEPVSSNNNLTGANSRNANIAKGPKDRDQEIQELRAKLALLEGDKNVKSEISHTAGRMKRERSGSNQSQSPPKRSRKSGHIETIDLTAD